MPDTNDPRYPIGRFSKPGRLEPRRREECIDEIAYAPRALSDAVDGLSREQLDTPYREGGWTVRQVVHHVADSHMNAFVRLRLALTEDNPTIRPYDQDAWSRMPDMGADVGLSLSLLDALHARWLIVLRAMDAAAFARTLLHPESGPMTLDDLLALYAWHGRHHTAHVIALRARCGW
jgi:uncharacterized damage-inducible protein DinB